MYINMYVHRKKMWPEWVNSFVHYYHGILGIVKTLSKPLWLATDLGRVPIPRLAHSQLVQAPIGKLIKF